MLNMIESKLWSETFSYIYFFDCSSSVKLQTSNNGLADPNNTPGVAQDLWSAPTQPKGPPGFPSDNWYNSIANSAPWGVNQQNSVNGAGAGSTWLLLRNLTAQVGDCLWMFYFIFW